jgi:uncharacterized protein
MKRVTLLTAFLWLAATFSTGGAAGGAALAANPAFYCSKVQKGSIEELICSDEGLSFLDRRMSAVYAEAAREAANEHPPVLKTEQRGWIKGRNECWKSQDKRVCVEENYTRRIAELQARYRLVPTNGPYRYFCDGDPRNEVVITFFKTDPPTLEAERGDSVSLMFLQPGESGSTYQGRNETLRQEQDGVRMVWGYGNPEMRCERKR